MPFPSSIICMHISSVLLLSTLFADIWRRKSFFDIDFLTLLEVLLFRLLTDFFPLINFAYPGSL